MKKNLLCRAGAAFGLGAAVCGLLVFGPAGTLRYAGGWLFMGVLFCPMAAAGAWLFLKHPQLLEKRLKAKETRGKQGLVVKLSGLMFVLGFAAAGLDFRFGWLALPGWVPVAAAAAFLAGYGLYALVLKENAYLSRVVEVQEGQTVVTTGPYAFVRHPMYSATLLMFLSMPLMLGSAVSLCFFLPYPLVIAGRIKDEEALLEEELEGYREYKQKVKYRLVPFVW